MHQMTISNHMATGALIGITVGEPWMALPLALLSHYVLDALPHYGYPDNQSWTVVFRHKLGIVVNVCDVTIAVILAAVLARTEPFALLTAVVALSPDFVWPFRYFFYERKGRQLVGGQLTRFHNRIQRYERPWGIFVEAPLLTATIALIMKSS